MTTPTMTTAKTDWAVGDLCRINGNVYRIEEIYGRCHFAEMPNCRVTGNAHYDEMEPIDK